MSQHKDMDVRDSSGLRSERILSLFLILAGGRLHTATELAKRFDVSIRTLYRDLDLLSAWGLPIEAIPGREGGFRVLPGYAVDRAVFGKDELETVAAAFGGVEEAVGQAATEGAGVKLAALLGRAKGRKPSWIRVALAPGGDERPLIDLLRQAIEERRLVRFDYCDAEGRGSERSVEPVAVAYLWQGWYLWAYCRLRTDWRLFKLARIRKPKSLMERFDPRPEPSKDAWRTEWEEIEGERIRIRISPSIQARVQENLGTGSATKEDPGRIFDFQLPKNEWLYSLLLGFGDGIEVLEPEDLRCELAERAKRIAAIYIKR
jgi:predicted DNA-binding transcriptional regulator YafY